MGVRLPPHAQSKDFCPRSHLREAERPVRLYFLATTVEESGERTAAARPNRFLPSRSDVKHWGSFRWTIPERFLLTGPATVPPSFIGESHENRAVLEATARSSRARRARLEWFRTDFGSSWGVLGFPRTAVVREKSRSDGQLNPSVRVEPLRQPFRKGADGGIVGSRSHQQVLGVKAFRLPERHPHQSPTTGLRRVSVAHLYLRIAARPVLGSQRRQSPNDLRALSPGWSRPS